MMAIATILTAVYLGVCHVSMHPASGRDIRANGADVCASAITQDGPYMVQGIVGGGKDGWFGVVFFGVKL